MARTDIAPACKTCEFWRQEFPDNPTLGVCSKMWSTEWPDRIAITLHTDDSENTGDTCKRVTTNAEFGCRGHSDFLLMRYKTL